MIIKMGGGPVTEEEAARSKDTGITIHTMEEVLVSTYTCTYNLCSSEGRGRCGEGQREGENVDEEGKREVWRGGREE